MKKNLNFIVKPLHSNHFSIKSTQDPLIKDIYSLLKRKITADCHKIGQQLTQET
jgi:hypothetical protein